MDAPVSGHHFTLRCIPISDRRQKIVDLQYYVFPEDYLSRSVDQWGNVLLCGLCSRQHTGFEANICGKAVTGLSGGTPARDPEKERIFCFETPLTKADGALKEFAAGLRTDAGAPVEAADGLRIGPGTLNEFAAGLRISSGAPEEAEAVMHAVHGALVYTPGATTVRTTAADAFALGKGVCQDYAHIMLAVLRAKRIPARYVAGMLLGEGESHAWVEVLHEGIWTPYDPTNDIVVTDQHIKLSHGRDAQDCAINRGVFRGSAGQSTDISVIVKECE